MLTSQATQKGAITYSDNIVEQVIDNAFAQFEDRMYQANYKGAVSDVLAHLGRFESLKEKKIEMTPSGLSVQLYAMIKFGESIAECCYGVLEIVAKDITELLELPVDDIKITLTGVITANNNIAKRSQTYSIKDL